MAKMYDFSLLTFVKKRVIIEVVTGKTYEGIVNGIFRNLILLNTKEYYLTYISLDHIVSIIYK